MNGFFAARRRGQLPNVSFIDPHFVDFPPGSNCDEPPSDIVAGQTLVQRIVEAVVAGPPGTRRCCSSSYDEHGGFYDHVPPPPAAQVSPESASQDLRRPVPAIVISPWVARARCSGTTGFPWAVLEMPDAVASRARELSCDPATISTLTILQF